MFEDTRSVRSTDFEAIVHLNNVVPSRGRGLSVSYLLQQFNQELAPFFAVAESPGALLDIVGRQQEPSTMLRVHLQFMLIIIIAHNYLLLLMKYMHNINIACSSRVSVLRMRTA